MANPTTNFGWQMPQNTDLVKDLPADFEVFGQAVDTDLADLKGGTTGQVLSKATNTDLDFTWVTPTDQTPLTTKGDLFTFTTVDARLGVGANGTVLTADSAEASGLKWATPSAGGYTLITDVQLSSSTGYSFSSIPSTYKHLVLTWEGLTIAAISSGFELRFNSDSGANYNIQYVYFETTGSPGVGALANTSATIETFGIHTYGTDAYKSARGSIMIYDYASTTRKKYYTARTAHTSQNNLRANHWITEGYWETVGTAISSLDITRVSGSSSISNLTDTSVRLYGVN